MSSLRFYVAKEENAGPDFSLYLEDYDWQRDLPEVGGDGLQNQSWSTR